MPIDLDDPIVLMPSWASTSNGHAWPWPISVLATREWDLEDARSVIEQLVHEIPDHDVRGRFARLSTAVC
jgi:hypothetical protein